MGFGHCRRVQWEESLVSLLIPEQTVIKNLFDNYKQQRTFTRVHEERIRALLQGVMFPNRELKLLPKLDARELSSRDIGEELFAAGLANDSVERVVQAMERIRRLSKWYENQADRKRPSELEIVAHMITPLMLGLGWSEQLMPIEWNRVDIAFLIGHQYQKRTTTTVLWFAKLKAEDPRWSRRINKPKPTSSHYRLRIVPEL